MRVAVLATVVESPGWRYDILNRFNARYRRLLCVTDRRVYQVVEDLLADGLVEVVERDPRQIYGATSRGLDIHLAWLVEGMHGDPERLAMIEVVAASALDEQMTLDLLTRYENQILADMSYAGVSVASIQSELLARERRMVNEARLRWVDFARKRLAQP